MSFLNHIVSAKIKLSVVTFSLLLAAYYFFCMNLSFLTRLYEVSKAHEMSTGFMLSVPVFFIAAFNVLFVPLCNNRVTKHFFAVLTMISAVVSYATYNYGIIFSRDMMVNIFSTNSAEAISYLNLSLVGWMFLYGVIPSVLIYKTEIVNMPRQSVMLLQLYSAVVSMLVVSVIAVLYYQDYAVTLRNNSDLKRVIVPTYVASSSIKLVKDKYFTSKLPYTYVGQDAEQVASRGKKTLTVLVVGETARADNYSLNGYSKDTNRYTKDMGVSFFKHVTSCGTETAVSVPCMFSNLTREGYSLQKAEARDNLMDVVARANVQTIWIDNNGGCKGVCKNTKTIDIREAYKDDKTYCGAEGCLDGAFLPEIKKQLAGLKYENTVIVLHLMGSHGPSYYKRYPKEMASFKPDCQRSDIQNCNSEALKNTYDNTILYTDKVLSQVMGVLSENDKKWDSMMLYVSDHGESLGEGGVYLHGLPYALAPVQQKHVPLMTWFSASSERHARLKPQCIASHAENAEYSQDNLFHTMLGLTSIRTAAYVPGMDIFAGCRSQVIAEK